MTVRMPQGLLRTLQQEAVPPALAAPLLPILNAAPAQGIDLRYLRLQYTRCGLNPLQSRSVAASLPWRRLRDGMLTLFVAA